MLEWIYVKNTGENVKHFPVKRLAPEIDINGSNLRLNHNASQINMIWEQTKQLFKPPLVKNFLIAIYIQTSIFVSSGGLGLWLPELLNRFSYSNATGTICDVIKGSISSTITFDETLSGKMVRVFQDTLYNSYNSYPF